MNRILAAKLTPSSTASTTVADDVAKVASPILRHRLILNFAPRAKASRWNDVIRKLLKAVPKNAAA